MLDGGLSSLKSLKRFLLLDALLYNRDIHLIDLESVQCYGCHCVIEHASLLFVVECKFFILGLEISLYSLIRWFCRLSFVRGSSNCNTLHEAITRICHVTRVIIFFSYRIKFLHIFYFIFLRWRTPFFDIMVCLWIFRGLDSGSDFLLCGIVFHNIHLWLFASILLLLFLSFSRILRTISDETVFAIITTVIWWYKVMLLFLFISWFVIFFITWLNIFIFFNHGDARAERVRLVRFLRRYFLIVLFHYLLDNLLMWIIFLVLTIIE